MVKIDSRRFGVSVEHPEVAHVLRRKQLSAPIDVHTGTLYGLVQLVPLRELQNL